MGKLVALILTAVPLVMLRGEPSIETDWPYSWIDYWRYREQCPRLFGRGVNSNISICEYCGYTLLENQKLCDSTLKRVDNIDSNMTSLNENMESMRERLEASDQFTKETSERLDKAQEHLTTVDGYSKNLNQQLENNVIETFNKITEVQSKLDDYKLTCEVNLKALNSQLKELEETTASDILNARNNVSDSLTTDLEVFKGSVEMSMSKVSQEIEVLDDSVKSVRVHLKTEIEALKRNDEEKLSEVIKLTNEKISKQNDAFTKKQEQFHKVLDDYTLILDSHKARVDEQFHHMSNETSSGLLKMSNDIQTTFNDKLNTAKLEFEEKIMSLQDRNTKQERELSDLRGEFETYRDNFVARLNQLEDELQTKEGTLQRNIANVENSVTGQRDKIDKVIYPNIFNKEYFIFAFLILVCLVVVNLLITCYLLNKPRAPVMYQSGLGNFTPSTKTPRSPTQTMQKLKLTGRSRKLVELEDAIGVVSFDEDTETIYNPLLDALINQLPMKVKAIPLRYHVIRRHEDTPGIPRTRLCLMFAEFHERHVIIEEQGIGLGDLKRKTVEDICASGAELVIVYVREPGSRRLGDRKLFNLNIHCATNQPELKVFSDKNRFFSIYNTLTDYQLQCLVEIVNKTSQFIK